jgi:hypothetical protein
VEEHQEGIRARREGPESHGCARHAPAGREWLNASQGQEEIENIRYAIKKSRAYGSEKWVSKAVGKFGLENTMRNRGRPKKGT